MKTFNEYMQFREGIGGRFKAAWDAFKNPSSPRQVPTAPRQEAPKQVPTAPRQEDPKQESPEEQWARQFNLTNNNQQSATSNQRQEAPKQESPEEQWLRQRNTSTNDQRPVSNQRQEAPKQVPTQEQELQKWNKATEELIVTHNISDPNMRSYMVASIIIPELKQNKVSKEIIDAYCEKENLTTIWMDENGNTYEEILNKLKPYNIHKLEEDLYNELRPQISDRPGDRLHYAKFKTTFPAIFRNVQMSKKSTKTLVTLGNFKKI